MSDATLIVRQKEFLEVKWYSSFCRIILLMCESASLCQLNTLNSIDKRIDGWLLINTFAGALMLAWNSTECHQHHASIAQIFAAWHFEALWGKSWIFCKLYLYAINVVEMWLISFIAHDTKCQCKSAECCSFVQMTSWKLGCSYAHAFCETQFGNELYFQTISPMIAYDIHHQIDISINRKRLIISHI